MSNNLKMSLFLTTKGQIRIKNRKSLKIIFRG